MDIRSKLPVLLVDCKPVDSNTLKVLREDEVSGTHITTLQGQNMMIVCHYRMEDGQAVLESIGVRMGGGDTPADYYFQDASKIVEIAIRPSDSPPSALRFSTKEEVMQYAREQCGVPASAKPAAVGIAPPKPGPAAAPPPPPPPPIARAVPTPPPAAKEPAKPEAKPEPAKPGARPEPPEVGLKPDPVAADAKPVAKPAPAAEPPKDKPAAAEAAPAAAKGAASTPAAPASEPAAGAKPPPPAGEAPPAAKGVGEDPRLVKFYNEQIEPRVMKPKTSPDHLSMDEARGILKLMREKLAKGDDFEAAGRNEYLAYYKKKQDELLLGQFYDQHIAPRLQKPKTDPAHLTSDEARGILKAMREAHAAGKSSDEIKNIGSNAYIEFYKQKKAAIEAAKGAAPPPPAAESAPAAPASESVAGTQKPAPPSAPVGDDPKLMKFYQDHIASRLGKSPTDPSYLTQEEAKGILSKMRDALAKKEDFKKVGSDEYMRYFKEKSAAIAAAKGKPAAGSKVTAGSEAKGTADAGKVDLGKKETRKVEDSGGSTGGTPAGGSIKGMSEKEHAAQQKKEADAEKKAKADAEKAAKKAAAAEAKQAADAKRAEQAAAKTLVGKQTALTNEMEAWAKDVQKFETYDAERFKGMGSLALAKEYVRRLGVINKIIGLNEQFATMQANKTVTPAMQATWDRMTAENVKQKPIQEQFVQTIIEKVDDRQSTTRDVSGEFLKDPKSVKDILETSLREFKDAIQDANVAKALMGSKLDAYKKFIEEMEFVLKEGKLPPDALGIKLEATAKLLSEAEKALQGTTPLHEVAGILLKVKEDLDQIKAANDAGELKKRPYDQQVAQRESLLQTLSGKQAKIVKDLKRLDKQIREVKVFKEEMEYDADLNWLDTKPPDTHLSDQAKQLVTSLKNMLGPDPKKWDIGYMVAPFAVVSDQDPKEKQAIATRQNTVAYWVESYNRATQVIQLTNNYRVDPKNRPRVGSKEDPKAQHHAQVVAKSAAFEAGASTLESWFEDLLKGEIDKATGSISADRPLAELQAVKTNLNELSQKLTKAMKKSEESNTELYALMKNDSYIDSKDRENQKSKRDERVSGLQTSLTAIQGIIQNRLASIDVELRRRGESPYPTAAAAKGYLTQKASRIVELDKIAQADTNNVTALKNAREELITILKEAGLGAGKIQTLFASDAALVKEAKTLRSQAIPLLNYVDRNLSGAQCKSSTTSAKECRDLLDTLLKELEALGADPDCPDSEKGDFGALKITSEAIQTNLRGLALDKQKVSFASQLGEFRSRFQEDFQSNIKSVPDTQDALLIEDLGEIALTKNPIENVPGRVTDIFKKPVTGVVIETGEVGKKHVEAVKKVLGDAGFKPIIVAENPYMTQSGINLSFAFAEGQADGIFETIKTKMAATAKQKSDAAAEAERVRLAPLVALRQFVSDDLVKAGLVDDHQTEEFDVVLDPKSGKKLNLYASRVHVKEDKMARDIIIRIRDHLKLDANKPSIVIASEPLLSALHAALKTDDAYTIAVLAIEPAEPGVMYIVNKAAPGHVKAFGDRQFKPLFPVIENFERTGGRVTQITLEKGVDRKEKTKTRAEGETDLGTQNIMDSRNPKKP